MSTANIYAITFLESGHANFPIQCRHCGHGGEFEMLCECEQYFFMWRRGHDCLCLASCLEVLFFAFGPVVLQTVWKLKAGSATGTWWMNLMGRAMEEPLEFFDQYRSDHLYSFVFFSHTIFEANRSWTWCPGPVHCLTGQILHNHCPSLLQTLLPCDTLRTSCKLRVCWFDPYNECIS